MKSKAAILTELNKPLLIDDVEIPVLHYGQVLVQVYATSICGAQLIEIAGTRGPDKYLPHLLGHEGAGIVIDRGEGVTHHQIGDHVVLHWRKGVGVEAQYPVYQGNGFFVGGGRVTTFNEYAVVSENRITSIPKTIPYDIASLMGCAITTGFGVINNEANLKMGQSIAISGCGGVGLSTILGAASVSAYPIIAIDIHQHKLKKAMTLGATHTIQSKGSSIQSEVQEITDGFGVDVFVECTGSPLLIREAYQVTASCGKTIMVGHPHHQDTLSIPSIVKHFIGKTLLDSQGGLSNPTQDIPRYLRLFQSGKLPIHNLITDYFPFHRINDVLDKMRGGEITGRCILMVNYPTL